EIDQRFLVRQRAQHVRRRLQRRQLTVSTQQIEFRIVLTEGGADIGLIRNAIAVNVFTEDQLGQHVLQLFAVRREVLSDADGAAVVIHDGNQVGGLRLFADEGAGRIVGAQQVLRRQRGAVEVQHQQSAIAILDV